MSDEQTAELHSADVRRERGSMSPERRNGVGSAILVVERDPAPAHSVRRLLELGGHQIRVARSAEECVGVLDLFRPDAVLLDFDLPGSSGLEALARIRAVEASPPVIVISSRSSVELAVEAMKAGAFDFLITPIALGKLQVLLDKARGARRVEGAREYYWLRDGPNAGLRHVLKRAVPVGATGVIDTQQLVRSTGVMQLPGDAEAPMAGEMNLLKLERDMLMQALERAHGNVTGAARLLGITRDTLRYRIGKHQLAAHIRRNIRGSRG
jgi:DNA-binding NtrC family response regulator